MEKRTVGIVATVITVLFCGCPGLFAVCFGAIAALAGATNSRDIDLFGNKDPQMALMAGLATCCFGVIFIIIPIAVGFFTLRKKAADGFPPVNDQPLPPL